MPAKRKARSKATPLDSLVTDQSKESSKRAKSGSGTDRASELLVVASDQAATSTRRTRSGAAKSQAEPQHNQEYEIYNLEPHTLTPCRFEQQGVPFKLLDLPVAIRNRIYRHAIGLHVVHVLPTRRKKKSKASGLPFTCRTCKAGSTVQTVVEQWEAGITSAIPCCRYTTQHGDGSQITLLSNLLRCSSGMYEEARRILFQDNIFAFQDSGPFASFLLHGLGASLRKESLTKLAIVITPGSRSTHLWNGMLGELYLPHGTMSSPYAHFPALRQLQLYLTNSTAPWPEVKSIPWRSPVWIWGFMYFALESLEAVSVVGKDYRVQNPAVSEGWRLLSEEEQQAYGEMVQGSLLNEWMGGEQDDVELMHITYYTKTRDCAWGEEGEGALPWAERRALGLDAERQ